MCNSHIPSLAYWRVGPSFRNWRCTSTHAAGTHTQPGDFCDTTGGSNTVGTSIREQATACYPLCRVLSWRGQDPPGILRRTPTAFACPSQLQNAYATFANPGWHWPPGQLDLPGRAFAAATVLRMRTPSSPRPVDANTHVCKIAWALRGLTLRPRSHAQSQFAQTARTLWTFSILQKIS
jgi:hypothetical protein